MEQILEKIKKAEAEADKIIAKAEKGRATLLSQVALEGSRKLKEQRLAWNEKSKTFLSDFTAELKTELKTESEKSRAESLRKLHSAEKALPKAVEQAVEALVKFKFKEN